jgi:hypothetical protein
MLDVLIVEGRPRPALELQGLDRGADRPRQGSSARGAMKRLLTGGAATVAQAAVARAATACPVCASETGDRIRAMLTLDPVWHFAVTIAPLPLLIAAVAAVRFATPWLSKERTR